MLMAITASPDIRTWKKTVVVTIRRNCGARVQDTVHIYVPRRGKHTTDEEFAGMIERMSRARREWLDRGYRVKFIK